MKTTPKLYYYILYYVWILYYILHEKLLMTPHLDSHSITDPNDEMLSAV